LRIAHCARTNARGRADGAAPGAGRCVIRKWLMQGCCRPRRDRLRVSVLFRQPSPDFRELYRTHPPVSIGRLSRDRKALFRQLSRDRLRVELVTTIDDRALKRDMPSFTSKSQRLVVPEIRFDETRERGFCRVARQPYPIGDAVVPQCAEALPGYENSGCIFEPFWETPTLIQPSGIRAAPSNRMRWRTRSRCPRPSRCASARKPLTTDTAFPLARLSITVATD
jgi:hypothetical protein